MADLVSDQTLHDMRAYYQERAAEYDEWFYRKGRYDHGAESTASWFADADQVREALDTFRMSGDVLELTAGTGIWTSQLIKTAASVTAVDASSNMIECNRAKVGSDKVTYIEADVFTWKPECLFDGVFFGFWLSHVPLERVDAFFQSVASMLRPGGKIFFVDSRPQQSMSAADHVLPEPDSQIMVRKLNDGRAFSIVKNFFDPESLERQCARSGLDVTVRETPNYFFFGIGTRQ